MEGPITALQTTLDCDWSPHNFIEVNFSKLTDRKELLGMALFAFIITSVKYHLKLLSSKFLLPMISSK